MRREVVLAGVVCLAVARAAAIVLVLGFADVDAERWKIEICVSRKTRYCNHES